MIPSCSKLPVSPALPNAHAPAPARISSGWRMSAVAAASCCGLRWSALKAGGGGGGGCASSPGGVLFSTMAACRAVLKCPVMASGACQAALSSTPSTPSAAANSAAPALRPNNLSLCAAPAVAVTAAARNLLRIPAQLGQQPVVDLQYRLLQLWSLRGPCSIRPTAWPQCAMARHGRRAGWPSMRCRTRVAHAAGLACAVASCCSWLLVE